MRRSPEIHMRHLVVALLVVVLAGLLAACTTGEPDLSSGPTGGVATEATAPAGDDAAGTSAPSDDPGGGTAEPDDATGPDDATAAPGAPTAAASIDVSAFEFGFTASSESVPAGEITFTLLNTGGMEHDLVLEGVDGAATDILGPTEAGSFTVTLEPGTYTLYCSVGTHRDLGMELEITVT